MPIQIVWQKEAVGGLTKHRIAVQNAELILSCVGEVIVDASWQLPAEQSLADQSVYTKQVQAYLLNPCGTSLEVRLLLQGTQYSQKIWQALLEIPFGEVISYSALADKTGSGPRAVAQACKNNPYAGIIPCHRVVSKNGIGGFMGQSKGEMVVLKQRLLAYERSMLESAK